MAQDGRSPEVGGMKDLDSILAAVDRARPFPDAVLKAMSLLEEPDISASKVVEVIQYDPVITMRVLRVCNSAAMGLRQRVGSVQKALMILGSQNMMRILASFGALELLSPGLDGYGLERGEMWRHAVACASMTQILLRAMDQPEDLSIFTGGLLHDVGKIVLDEYVRRHGDEIARLIYAMGCSSLEAEVDLIGVDHAEVGALLADRWRLPSSITTMIRRHHEAVHPSRDPMAVCLVHLSNVLCLQMGIGTGGQGMAVRAAPELIEAFGLTPRLMDSWASSLWTELDRVKELLDTSWEGD